MEIADLIGAEDVMVNYKTSCKKELLQDLSDVASHKTGIPSRKIYETLFEREKLGSTGVGNGIAIPHGKLEGLDQISGLFIVLDKPIDFDSIDDEPVDVVFLLLAPEGAGADHLKALARVARVLREPGLLQKLRESNDRTMAHHLLTGEKTPHAA